MIERYAAVVCDWSLEVGRGTRLLVDGPLESKPLATAVAAHAWRAGATVSVNLQPSWSSPVVTAPDLAAELDGAFDAVCEIHHVGRRCTEAAHSPLRRVRCAWPTDHAAQSEGVGTLRLAATVFSACLLDQSDPIAAWRAVAARNERAIARLGAASRLSAGGAELALSGVDWVGEAGRTCLPGAAVTGVLREGTLVLETRGSERSALLDGRALHGPIALDGVEVTAW